MFNLLCKNNMKKAYLSYQYCKYHGRVFSFIYGKHKLKADSYH